MYFEKNVESFTQDQKLKLTEIKDEFFGYAVSTETIKELAESAVSKYKAAEYQPTNQVIQWVKNPIEGHSLYCEYSKKELAGKRYNYTPKVSHTPLLLNTIESAPQHFYLDILLPVTLGNLKSSLDGPLGAGRFGTLCTLECASLNSVTDSWWVAYAKFFVGLPRVNCPKEAESHAKIFEDLLKSTFAVWLFGRQVVLCKKPIRVDLDGATIRGFEFED